MTETQTEQLDAYILHPNPFNGLEIPKRLAHADVARFITEKINKDTPFASLVRVETVVSFYDLHEACPHLLNLLSSANQVASAVALARTVLASGSPAEAQRAASIARALISNAKNSTEIKELIELQDRLGPYVDSTDLNSRINFLRNVSTGPESTRLGELASMRLPRVNAANQVKAQVLAIQDRKHRILEELKMYLTLEHGYLEYLTPWAIARLRRETWAPQPAQQTTRKDDPALRSEVAQIFLTAANNMDRMPGVLPDNRQSLRVRCLRAAEFFGHALTPEDRGFISKHAGGQVDMLSND